MRILGIIPARGGSQRLPGKNTRDFAGKPLIAHTIDCAKACPALSRTIVSTDSPEIAEAARAAGGDVPWLRPPELALAESSSMDAIRHALLACEAEEGEPYQGIVLLQPTSPLRLASDVQRGIEVWRGANATLVCSVSEPAHPASYLVEYLPSGEIRPIDARAQGSESPPVHPLYRYNGAVYVYRAEVVRERPDEVASMRRAFVMPRWRSADIDTLQDFIEAEAIYLARAHFLREGEE